MNKLLMNKIHSIVLAGGSGTRFWPLSREKKPKQLLEIFSNQTLLETTIERISPISTTISISTGTLLAEQIKVLVPGRNLIVEPVRRDTAAAIGLCAIQYDDNDILAIFPSDAYVRPDDKFRETILQAADKAQRYDSIVLVGIQPTHPAIGYGYIEPSETDLVESFREKPDFATAQNYIERGFLWNAGIFVAKAGVILNEFARNARDIYDALMAIKNGGDTNAIYATIRRTSFDFAIMERASKIHFVPASFFWNDVGSFDALGDIFKGRNAIIKGQLSEINSSGNVVLSNKRIALIDCNDMVIVDTDDAILVCPKSSLQKVKQLVEQELEEYMK